MNQFFQITIEESSPSSLPLTWQNASPGSLSSSSARQSKSSSKLVHHLQVMEDGTENQYPGPVGAVLLPCLLGPAVKQGPWPQLMCYAAPAALGITYTACCTTPQCFLQPAEASHGLVICPCHPNISINAMAFAIHGATLNFHSQPTSNRLL